MCTVSDLLVPRLIELRLRASVIWCNHRNGVLHLIYSRRPRRWFIEVRESIRIPFSWLAKLQNIVLFLFVSMKARSSKRPRFFPMILSRKIREMRLYYFRISLRWPIHIINPVDKIQLSRYTSHRRSTTVSFETYPSIHLFYGFWKKYFLRDRAGSPEWARYLHLACSGSQL